MNPDILKLAKEFETQDGYYMLIDSELEAFYRAAFNAGLEAAAKVCDVIEPRISSSATTECAAAIRSMK